MNSTLLCRRSLGAGLLALAVAACSVDDGLLTAPEAASFSHGGTVHEVELCKTGPEGSWATFEISATGGQLLLGSEVTITDVQPFGVFPAACVVVWRSTDLDVEQVTITEVDMTPGTFVEDIVVFGTTVSSDVGSATVTVEGSAADGAFVIFKNEGEPTNGGFEGCTPGFWRQAHHYQYWTGYDPTDTWGDVFADPGSHVAPGRHGVEFTAGLSLGQAVQLNGGGIFALARHAVAAILNANSPDVDYPLTAAEIVDLVNAAIASEDYEYAKNVLEWGNELGCDIK